MNWPGMKDVARLRAQRVVPVRRVRVTEVCDQLVVPIHERDAAVEIGYHDETLVFVEVARQPETGDEIDVGAVEREALQAVVPPIGDDQHGFVTAVVHPDAVRLVQLPGV